MGILKPTCTRCGTRHDPGRRRTQETVDDHAARDGWILGLPAGRTYCPTCAHTCHQCSNPAAVYAATGPLCSGHALDTLRSNLNPTTEPRRHA